MKLFKKINRGLILTTAVIVVVAIYLVTLSVTQGKERPVIEETCKNYVQTAVNYKMLPEKFRTEKPDISEDELNTYINKMNEDLKAFYTDNEQTYKFLLTRNKDDLEGQAQGNGVVYKYQKEIKKFDRFDFDGKTVTVTIQTDSVLVGPNIITGAPKESISAQTTDTITLQKTDGEWKIIYADLQQPMKAETNGTGVMYKTTVSY